MSELAEGLLRRDRAIVAAGLAALVVLAWAYLAHLASSMGTAMPGMPAGMGMGMAMPRMHAWTPVDLVLLVAMWAVMMVAMMLPSASPMILIFTTLNRRRPAPGRPLARTGLFVLGYVVIWSAYSVLAGTAQWLLHQAAVISPLAAAGPYLGGALLIAAGLFQFTPLKRACLAVCRSPLSFLMAQWREGGRGAFRMGLRHGMYCLGCCWVLMALLFVAGVMNLAWAAVVAAFVLVEKVMPGGERISAAGGVVLAAAGVLLLARGAGAPA